MNNIDIGYWVIAAYQHLRIFAVGSENIHEFGATTSTGRVALFLNAIRDRGILTYEEMKRIAATQNISQVELSRQIIPELQLLDSDRILIKNTKSQGWILEEHITTNSQFYQLIGELWNKVGPSTIEIGAIFVLRDTYIRPREHIEELSLLANVGLNEQNALSTLAISTSFHLVKSFGGKERRDEGVVFNPYIWRNNQDKIASALKHLPEQEKVDLTASIELVSTSQAFPIAQLDIKRSLLDMAHSIGLVDIVQVTTASGDRKEFLCTPHLNTHPDEAHLADDLLNDVRAVLACVGYGEHYSVISKLGGENREKTILTLRKLLRNKEAGDATAIGVDYKILEERGIITVKPTNSLPSGRFKMVLLRDKPVKIALTAIEQSVISRTNTPAFVRIQELDAGTVFAGPESTRVQSQVSLGEQPQEIREARAHYLNSIRQEVF